MYIPPKRNCCCSAFNRPRLWSNDKGSALFKSPFIKMEVFALCVSVFVSLMRIPNERMGEKLAKFVETVASQSGMNCILSSDDWRTAFILKSAWFCCDCRPIIFKHYMEFSSRLYSTSIRFYDNACVGHSVFHYGFTFRREYLYLVQTSTKCIAWKIKHCVQMPKNTTSDALKGK